MKLHLQRRVATAVAVSPHVLQVAAMFGLGIDEERVLEIIPPTELELGPGQVVFVTGASGSGKSSLLGLVDEAVRARAAEARVFRFDALPALPDRPLVDCFGEHSLEQVMRWLSLAGLNDAFVMLRRPGELSDGQRYRLRLAQVMAAVARAEDGRLAVVLADEFGAALDRLTAAVIARNVRKWVSRMPVCFVAATTHDDLLEPLEPDVLVEKQLGEGIEVVRRGESGRVA